MNPTVLIKALTRGIHQLLSQTKLTKEAFDKATLVEIVRGLTELVDQLPGVLHNAKVAHNCVATTKKLIAKTIIFVSVKNAGKDSTAARAEFQKRVQQFKEDFKLVVALVTKISQGRASTKASSSPIRKGQSQRVTPRSATPPVAAPVPVVHKKKTREEMHRELARSQQKARGELVSEPAVQPVAVSKSVAASVSLAKATPSASVASASNSSNHSSPSSTAANSKERTAPAATADTPDTSNDNDSSKASEKPARVSRKSQRLITARKSQLAAQNQIAKAELLRKEANEKRLNASTQTTKARIDHSENVARLSKRYTEKEIAEMRAKAEAQLQSTLDAERQRQEESIQRIAKEKAMAEKRASVFEQKLKEIEVKAQRASEAKAQAKREAAESESKARALLAELERQKREATIREKRIQEMEAEVLRKEQEAAESMRKMKEDEEAHRKKFEAAKAQEAKERKKREAQKLKFQQELEQEREVARQEALAAAQREAAEADKRAEEEAARLAAEQEKQMLEEKLASDKLQKRAAELKAQLEEQLRLEKEEQLRVKAEEAESRRKAAAVVKKQKQRREEERQKKLEKARKKKKRDAARKAAERLKQKEAEEALKKEREEQVRKQAALMKIQLEAVDRENARRELELREAEELAEILAVQETEQLALQAEQRAAEAEERARLLELDAIEAERVAEEAERAAALLIQQYQISFPPQVGEEEWSVSEETEDDDMDVVAIAAKLALQEEGEAEDARRVTMDAVDAIDALADLLGEESVEEIEVSEMQEYGGEEDETPTIVEPVAAEVALMEEFQEEEDDEIEAEIAMLEAEGMRQANRVTAEDFDADSLIKQFTDPSDSPTIPRHFTVEEAEVMRQEALEKHEKEVAERRRKLQWLPATKAGLIDAYPPEQSTQSGDDALDDDAALWDMVDDALRSDLQDSTPSQQKKPAPGAISAMFTPATENAKETADGERGGEGDSKEEGEDPLILVLDEDEKKQQGADPYTLGSAGFLLDDGNSSSMKGSSKDSSRAGQNHSRDRKDIPAPSKATKLESSKEAATIIGTVKLQVIEGKGFMKGVHGNKVVVVISRKKIVGEKGKPKKIFSTSPKKADTPVWNESFQINVHDSENEAICISLQSAGIVSKSYPGQILLRLDDEFRNFDHPNYSLTWYTIHSPSGKVGKLKLYVEYFHAQKR